MLNEKGLLSETPTIKLLLTVFEENLTGYLYIKRQEIVKALYFKNGELVWASSSSDVDKIENILLLKGLVKPIIIEELKRENELNKSAGKLLLERGIITLEEFIKFTKEQLGNIIISVLNWREGEYRYVKEPPPDNQFNLDLNIMSFVFNFIINDLDESIIMREIGSFHTKLVRNFDEIKIKKYSLSDKQKEILFIFDNEIKLEDFLSRYSETNKRSLLKIVYFFLMAELILKDEFELPDISTLDEKDNKDDLGEFKIETKQDNLYIIDGYKKEEEDENSVEKEEDFDIQKMISEEEKQGKSFNFIILFIVLIFIIGSIILYLLLSESKKENKIDNYNKKEIINVEDRKSIVKKDNKGFEILMQKGDSKQEKLDKSPDKNKKNIENMGENKTRNNYKSKRSESPDALSYFNQGKYEIAAGIWKKELKKKNIKYTILLEYDMLKESVFNAYKKTKDKNRFFIITKKKNNRIGFLVMWGMFDTEHDAARALIELPGFFLNQKPSAKVIDLEQYIE